MTEIPESAMQAAAKACGPDSPFQKVLDDAGEMRARGSVVRFVLTESGEIAAQEGVIVHGKEGLA